MFIWLCLDPQESLENVEPFLQKVPVNWVLTREVPKDHRPALLIGEVHGTRTRPGRVVRASTRELKAAPLAILQRLGVDWAEQDLYQELVAKERVIQELLVYRKTSLHYLLLDRLLGRLGPRGWSYWNCFDRATYPPKTLLTSKPAPPPASAPSIALVTPSYQQACFLGSTLQSVLSQGYPRLQYWIQDGGSTDGSVEVIQRYQEHLSGWESATDEGQAQAINRGFSRVSGELMGWLNSDDQLLPGALSTVASYFLSNPEVDVVYGHRILVNADGQDIGRWIMPPHVDSIMSWCDLVPQETLFWRRSLWNKVGGLDETFDFAMDWDLLLRFRAAGARFAIIPRFLGAFRVHPSQKTSSVMLTTGQREMDRLRRRTLGRNVSPQEIFEATVPYYRRAKLEYFLYRLGIRKLP